MIASLFLIFFAQQDSPAAAIAEARVKFAVDSFSWTGVEERLRADEGALESIRVKLEELNGLVEKSGLTNHETQQAKAITEALLKLVAAPSPDWRAVTSVLLAKPIELLVSKPVVAAATAFTIIDAIMKLIHG